MATVYLAKDLKHGRQVAIKVLRPELAAALGAERFLREIKITAGLNHPHILTLLDSGQADGLLYYVMPYVAGESLRDRLNREKQLPLDDALRIVREVADALGFAHSHGVVHRDIKPSNVLLSDGHAVVADFGIARAISAAGGEQLTDSGVAIGTPAYMSPEQGTGEVELDGRTDIYSLGCTLFEMLVGEPPFTGPTAQAIIARHVSQRPQSIRVVRPTVPVELEEVVERALAKVPADRFPTAEQFADAINAFETGAFRTRPVGRGRRGALALAVVGVVGLAVLAWRVMVSPPASLDANRVVVFPLRVNSNDVDRREVGEDIATLILYGLDGAGPLKLDEGWYLLEPLERDDIRLLTAERAREIARGQRAAYFIDGQALFRGDSADILLTLHDVVGDSVAKRGSAAGMAVEASQLGLAAVTGLLPTLIPGEPVDLSALSERQPAAIAYFLQAEREYRRAHFREALPHYQRAVQIDSLLAIAALKGAQSASWNRDTETAETLVEVALGREMSLPERHVYFAEGLLDYYRGAADAAVVHFKEALRLDPEWRDAWMALGEVYTHLLPSEAPLDSLAEAAFAEARRLDPDFTPPFFHLLELALRQNDLTTARRLMPLFRDAEPDSGLVQAVELMLECVEKGPGGVDWRAAVQRAPDAVLEAANSLSAGGAQPECAEEGWRAILRHDSDPAMARHWGAVFGLQSLLVARGRYAAVTGLLDSAVAAGVPGVPQFLYVIDAAAGAPLESRASAVLDSLGRDYTELSGPRLWLSGIWHAHLGNADHVTEIAGMLAAAAAASDARMDRLLAESMLARAALVRADSAEALRRLGALVPTGRRRQLASGPWESLAGEQLALAELLLARGQFAEALRVASIFDSPTPVMYLIYLPASLSVRLRAARALGEAALAERFRARLVALGRNDLLKSSP